MEIRSEAFASWEPLGLYLKSHPANFENHADSLEEISWIGKALFPFSFISFCKKESKLLNPTIFSDWSNFCFFINSFILFYNQRETNKQL